MSLSPSYPEDSLFLEDLSRVHASHARFILTDTLHGDCDTTRSAANEVLIKFEGQLLTAYEVMRLLESRVSFSMIFEQWNAWVFGAVHKVCRNLSAIEARALLVASEYASVSADHIYDVSDKAVSEAQEALYGEC